MYYTGFLHFIYYIYNSFIKIMVDINIFVNAWVEFIIILIISTLNEYLLTMPIFFVFYILFVLTTIFSFFYLSFIGFYGVFIINLISILLC
jgi:hypothetical protein